MRNKNKAIPPGVIKKQTRGADAKKLDYLEMHLVNAGIPVVREEGIKCGVSMVKHRYPDLRVTTNNILIEHDTVKVHGELSEPNTKTLRRNCDYLSADIPFVVINEDLCKMFNLDQGDLAIYLYYHKLMELKSREELLCFYFS